MNKKSDSKLTIASRYIVFAAISTASNIGGQDAVTTFYTGSLQIELSMLVGTAIGLFTKYILDKRYIFSFNAKSKKQDGLTFLLYSFMGVATTIIFWGTEYLFHLIFQTKEMRYLGAIIGLSVGYFTKYHLDKHFVFQPENRSKFKNILTRIKKKNPRKSSR